MEKIYTREEVLHRFADGQRIMVGGFANHGVPEYLIDGIIETGVKNLTIISNDSGDPGIGVGKLISSRRTVKIICSFIGKHPEAVNQYASGELEVELVPLGTLMERIRCGGAGLGGALVRTGLGTLVEKDKEKIIVNNKSYLLETPLQADISLVKAWKADTMGNLVYRGSSRNCNPLMATAGKLVIVETEEIVPVGTIDPDQVITPGVLVHMIVVGKGDH